METKKVLTDAEIDQLEDPEIWQAAVVAKIEAETVRIPVIGGLCEISFTPGFSCGTDPDADPGISFQLTTHRDRRLYALADGTFACGRGVFTRSHALALREMLDRFLAEHPPVVGFG